LPFTIPFTVQVIALLGAPALVTVAAKVTVEPVRILVPGLVDRETETSLLTVMIVPPAWDGPFVAPTEMAVTVGRVMGAVYSPVDEIVPSVLSPPTVLPTIQVVTGTLEENCNVLPRRTVLALAVMLSVCTLLDEPPPPQAVRRTKANRQVILEAEWKTVNRRTFYSPHGNNVKRESSRSIAWPRSQLIWCLPFHA
jgi:hypothetical protein